MRKNAHILSVVLLFIVLKAFNAIGNEANSELKVGASKIEISPPANMFPGKGEWVNYAGVHDPLFVRTIVMDNGKVKSALVSLDLAGVPSGNGEFVNNICQAVGIEKKYMFISATHDHSTIRISSEDNSSEYYNLIKEATIRSLKEAESKIQPACVGYGTGKAYVNTNRDKKVGDEYRMGYVPEGPSDKTVAVVTFNSLTGSPIAIYTNYPVHAVTMYRAKTKDGRPEVTSDLPGYTSRFVEAHFEGAIALWSSGAAGDQNPLFMANYNQDEPDVFDTGAAGYIILDLLSRRLGEEIVRVTESIKNTTSDVQIWSKQSSVTCPGQKLNRQQGSNLAVARKDVTDGEPVIIPLHLLMINDIALAGISAEVFTEIGIHLKEQSVFDRTMMVTVMPDKIGYIPTDEAFLLPAAKAKGNRLKPGYAEPAIIDEFKKMMLEYISLRATSLN